ncbi:serine hydrolase domain-containing protein [Parapedobacter composti]|nr:serine hydrolase domain-containing protein [Parapedobacter composti]
MNIKPNVSLLLLMMAVSLGVYGQQQTGGKRQQLEALFTYLHEHDMFNGAVAVKDQGKLIFRAGFGVGNFETGTPFLPQSQTEIASVSKQFTATAIMLLRDEGKLRLDDDINRYFTPALPYEGITIRQLLTHTSGVPDYEKYFRENWHTSDLVYNKDIIHFLHVEKPPLQFPPGSTYQYSNLGYVLLAEIVEACSGIPLDVFLHQRIFAPHAMSSTGFFVRNTIFRTPGYAPGVVWDSEACQYVRPETQQRYAYVGYLSGRLGPGRLTSTVDDLLKWDSLLYTDGILPDSSLQEMFSPMVSVPNTPGHYGYGWRVLPPDGKGREVFHTGAWPGNYTLMKRYIDDKSTIILLNNTYSPYMVVIRNTVDAILKGRAYEWPKKHLHEVLKKTLCRTNVDADQWLHEQGDFTSYIIDYKAIDALNTEIQKHGDEAKKRLMDNLLKKLKK